MPNGSRARNRRRFRLIPNGERKHSSQPSEHGLAVFLEHLQKHLGVAGRTKATSFRFEFAAQFEVVVNLAIEGDDAVSIGAAHGLGAIFGEIDNGEPAMAESDSIVGRIPLAFAVGAASLHAVEHPAHFLTRNGIVRMMLEDHGDTAHRVRVTTLSSSS
jgi:hypothetical protein